MMDRGLVNELTAVINTEQTQDFYARYIQPQS